MKAIIAILLAFCLSMGAVPKKQTVIDRFILLKPSFDSARMEMWSDFYRPSLFCAGIEQESNWKQFAQLKTSYELGRGLGQLTITYNKNGTEKMNVFEDLRRRNPRAFASWKYREDPFNAVYQLKSALFLHKVNWNIVSPHFKDMEQKAKANFTAYNCGAGRILQDIRLCKRVWKNCDSWDNGVAVNSVLSKKPLTAEYSKSPFQINREYAPLIWERAVKYQRFYK